MTQNRLDKQPERTGDLEHLVKKRMADVKRLSIRLQEEIKRHEQTVNELEKNRRKYRFLVNNATEGIIITQRGVLKLHNPKIRAMTGYAAHELEAKPFIDLIHPEDRQQIINHHAARIAGEPVNENYVVRALRKNGAVIWVETHSEMVEWEGMPATLSFITDVTDRISAEAALKASERLYRNLYHNSMVGLVRSRIEDGQILNANRAAAHFLGYRDAEEMVKTCKLAEVHTPQRRQELLKQLREHGSVSGFESTLTLKDGTRKDISISARIYEEDGYIEAVLLDVSHQKATEEALKLSIEAAEAANVAKSEFLANMSHEIRTPLNGIIGMCDLVIDTASDDKQLEYLNIIRNSGVSLLELINDILDLSKIEAGKLELEDITFSLRKVIEDTADFFFDKIAVKHLELVIDLDPAIPSLLIADPLRLRQVLINLLSNAVKFTDTGEICIHVHPIALDEDTVELQFSVRDTGIGIAQDAQRHLFDAFTQADGSITRRYGGTGLGLAICKRIVSMMNGRIWVESREGQGSNFCFTASFRIHVHATADTRQLPSGLDQVRALVIDDNPTALAVTVRFLEGMGIPSQTVRSGEDAVQVCRYLDSGDTIELLVVNNQLPGMDGIATVKQIRQVLSDQPAVIMTTTGSEKQVLQQANQAGIQAVLAKPLKQSPMFDTIMGLFGGGKTTVSLPHNPSESEDMFQGVHVLLVEDNPINQRVAAEMLTSVGITADIADNGLKAVEKVRQGAYDAVLMDIQMPEMDGYDTTRMIRKRLGNTSLPVIALTAHTMSGDREKCLRAGMNDFVSKPIDRSDLFDTLRRNLDAAVQPANPGAAPPVSRPDHPALTHDSDNGVLDVNEGVARIGGNRAMFIELLNDYIDLYRDFPKVFLPLIEKADYPAARHRAHALKGAAGNIAAKSLFAVAKDLEAACADRDPEQITDLFACVETELARLFDAVQRLS